MSFAILLKDSKPDGVTESEAVDTAARPCDRTVGSNEPRTSISLPKISAMELRYSCSVRRRRLTTYARSGGGAATATTPPEIAKINDRAARSSLGNEALPVCRTAISYHTESSRRH